MEWERFTGAVVHHRWMILALIVSSIAQAVAVTYMVDEEYSSSVLVLVRPQEKMRLTQEGRERVLDIALGANAPHEAPTNTFTEIIKSRSIAEDVTKKLGLHTLTRAPGDSYWEEQWLQFKDEMKQLLRDAWDLLRFGRLIERDPFDTAAFHVAKNLSVEPTNKSYVFQIAAAWKNPVLARNIANAAADAFVNYVANLGTGEARGRSKFVAAQLENTQAELARAREELRAYKQEHRSVAFDEEAKEKIRVVADLESSLASTMAELAGQEIRYSRNAPEVSALRAERDSLQASVDALKEELEDLPEKEQELARLELRVSTLVETYELLAREFQEARLDSILETSDVQVVTYGTISSTPDKPVKVFYAAASGFLALMLGVVIAVLFEAMELSYIRSVEDAEEALKLPVLATLPSAPSS